LHFAAWHIHRQQGANFDAIALLGHEIGMLRASAEHHAAHLRLGVLDGKIPMTAGRAREVRYLAADPGQREAPLEHAGHGFVQI
jgi:hypothetical protein